MLHGAAAAALIAGGTLNADAMSVREAVQIALDSNPEVNEAVANREAREFELRQAHGLYLPQVDLEARTGTQRLDSPGTRSGTIREDGVITSPLLNDDETYFNRSEANVVVQQLLFDGFNRRGERHFQAARVDSASHRVYERSEAIALNVVREYLDVVLSYRILKYAEDNVAYHRTVLGNLREGTEAEAISIADRQQAEERLYSAEARVIEATEELNSAKIRFFKLVGKPLDHHQGVPSVAGSLPKNLAEAIGVARENNPNINIAEADLDAAYGQVMKARSEFYPKIALEATARTGENLEAIRGSEQEFRAEVVARWNIFRGRIDANNVQEQVRHVDEERYGLHRAYRDVEEAVRLSWDRRYQQSRRLQRLEEQLASTESLITSYAEQFKVGDRSLLDLLDTQNTRFNTQIAVETARQALQLAEYRILASTGLLLNTMQLNAPQQADAYARVQERVPATPEGETMKRFEPKRRWHTVVEPAK